MSGGVGNANAGEIGRLRRDLDQALADIELLKGDTGDTGAAGPTGSTGATGATGAQGTQGVKGDASDAPVLSVGGEIGEVNLNHDQIAAGETFIGGGWAEATIPDDESDPILRFDQNYLYKTVSQAAAFTFVKETDPPPVNGAVSIVPINSGGQGFFYTSDFEYYSLAGASTEMPEWKETADLILVFRYHSQDDKVYVTYHHPKWLERASADPTFLTFEWDAIHPEEVQSGAEVIGIVPGTPSKSNGKRVLLPFDSDGSGVTWGSEFVDIRDRDNASLPDLTDSEKYALEMQYDEVADEVLVKSWPMEPILMILSAPDVAQNLNQVVLQRVQWTAQDRIKTSTYTHSLVSSKENMIVDVKGLYRWRLDLEMEAVSNSLPASIRQVWQVNSVTVGVPAYSQTLETSRGREEASIQSEIILNLVPTDVVKVMCNLAANAGVVNPTLGIVSVEKIG